MLRLKGEPFMKIKHEKIMHLLSAFVLFIVCGIFLVACANTNTGTNNKPSTGTKNKTETTYKTLNYAQARYVSSEWEDAKTGGMYYDFDMKYDGLSAQLYMGGGFVKGNTEQVIKDGEYGSEVVAIPYDGFEFIKWSDGLTTPSRKDKSTYCFNVVDSAWKNKKPNEVYPLFAKRHTVYFGATSGGRIIGELIQTIATGKSSSELVAIADDGYIFMGWYHEDPDGSVYPGSITNRITKSNTLIYDPFHDGLPQTNSYVGQGYVVATFIEKRN